MRSVRYGLAVWVRSNARRQNTINARSIGAVRTTEPRITKSVLQQDTQAGLLEASMVESRKLAKAPARKHSPGFTDTGLSRAPNHENHIRSRDRSRSPGDPGRRVLEAHDHARRRHHRRSGDGRRDFRPRGGAGHVLRAHHQRAVRAGRGRAPGGGPPRGPRCVPAGRALRLRLPRVPVRSQRVRRHRDRTLGHCRPGRRPAALRSAGRPGAGARAIRGLCLHGGSGRRPVRCRGRPHHGRHRGRGGRGGRRPDVRVQGGPPPPPRARSVW